MESPGSSAHGEDWDSVSPLPLRREMKQSGVRVVPRMLIALEDMDDDVESCSNRIDDGIIMEMKAPPLHNGHPIRQRRTNADDLQVTSARPETRLVLATSNGQKHPRLWDEFRDVSSSVVNEFMGKLRYLWQPVQQWLWIPRRRSFRCGGSRRFKRICATLILLALVTIMVWAGYIFTLRREILKSVTPFDRVKQRSPSWTTPAARAQWAVFYTAYISINPILSEYGRLLVQEQLSQVASSYAASANDLMVYTTVIGQALQPQWLDQVCASGRYNLTCVLTAQYKTIDESVPLTRIKEYCHDHADQSVIYLHNKGSLDPGSNGNNRWRRTMTAATTSKLCLAPPRSKELDQCSTCGLLFQTLPRHHYPGNMWTANCTYINQILSPKDYRTRHRIVDEWLNTQIQFGVYTPNGGLFAMEEHYTGHEEVMDYWLGSYPDFVPCDVSKTASLDYWLDEDQDFVEFEVAVAPRHDINANWNWYSYTVNNSTLTDSFKRKRDYFLLRGMVYRCMVFYNHIPEWESYVWDWYPDGALWREEAWQRDPWTSVNAVINLPGTTKIEEFYLPVTEEEGVSDMRANVK